MFADVPSGLVQDVGFEQSVMEDIVIVKGEI